MEKKYILNRETGKIELHFEKSEYQEMPEDKKRILRSNYLFSRKAEAWVSRAKYPNLYSAKHATVQSTLLNSLDLPKAKRSENG